MSKGKVIDERILDETYLRVVQEIQRQTNNLKVGSPESLAVWDVVTHLKHVPTYMETKREVLAELKKESNS